MSARKAIRPAGYEPMPTQDERIAAVAKRYGWYIDHAFGFRKREIEKQLANARKTLTDEAERRNDPNAHPRDQEAYESLESMADHLEWVQREFNEAHEALKAAGIK